jgi:ketosteroid isomerase-like protein
MKSPSQDVDGSAAIMWNTLLRSLFVVSALALGACASSAPPADAAIRAANEQLEQNARRHDLERLVRDYYENGSVAVFGGKEHVRGLEAAKEAWKALLAKGDVEFVTDRVESSCDLATEMGRWTLRVKAEEHDVREEHGSYYVAWRRTNGQWKAVMQFFSPEGFHEAE